MSNQSYLDWVIRNTHTQWWHDSAQTAELALGLERVKFEERVMSIEELTYVVRAGQAERAKAEAAKADDQSDKENVDDKDSGD